MNIFKRLQEDVRFEEGLKSCMNCGVCTAICPAAEFFDYDPRVIVSKVQGKNESVLEELLTSDTIWYCGQCMSCKTRCPRNNCPGMVIQTLRKVSQETGLFMKSERGRQQVKLKRVIGQSIVDRGYCVHPVLVVPEQHPEQGPMWEWVYNNMEDVYERLGANFNQLGPGVLRKVDDESMDELHAILDQTGCSDFFNKIEEHNYNTSEQEDIDHEGRR